MEQQSALGNELAVDSPRGVPHGWVWPVLSLIVIVRLGVELLRIEGHRWWCACGQPALWAGNIWSEHNSQHLFDPYSFTHLSHGLIFFIGFSLIAPLRRWRIAWRLVLAVGIEMAWEILENSHWVIDRYRHATLALGYQGDTIANSLGDVVCCALGFFIAMSLGLRRSVLLFVAIELMLLLWIRDNLALNVLMLLHPVAFVRSWQLAGHG